MPVHNITDIINVFYINLDHRVDRKIHIEKQLAALNLTGTRFNAIKHEKPLIGCTLSHIECLSVAHKNNYDHILICEDDMLVLDPHTVMNRINRFLETHDDWNVVLLGGNNVAPYKSIDETSVQVNKCQTTTAYLINGPYIKTVLDNFNESLTTNYPFDLYWWGLQQQGKWYLLNPISVVQRADYSDIQLSNVNYEVQMTRLKYNQEKN